mgnify:CR=1 FL=1
MKLLNKYICGLGFGALMLTATSCVEETEPTKFANQSQVNASSAATEALAYAMPMYFNNVDEDLLDGDRIIERGDAYLRSANRGVVHIKVEFGAISGLCIAGTH